MDIIKISVEVDTEDDFVNEFIILERHEREGNKINWSSHKDSKFNLVFEETIGVTLVINEKDKKIISSDSTLRADMEDLLTIYYENKTSQVEDDNDYETPKNVIRSPYNPSEIKVTSTHFTLSDIIAKIERQDIDLNPEFQRHLVWSNKDKSRLIESILLGIPLPIFYFAQDKEGIYSIIDGMQRLNTIYDFMMNRLVLRNMEHLYEYNGKYYCSSKKVKEDQALSPFLRRRVDDTKINVNIIESGSPDKLKYDIFRRINLGGKPLNQQEIRNSLARKEVRKLLYDLAYSNEFRIATSGVVNKQGENEPGINDTRMVAQEIILRYIGFYIDAKESGLKYRIPPKNKLRYAGDMNDYLDSTLDHLNILQYNELELIKKTFLRAIRNCYHLFGSGCFRKCELQHIDSNGQLIKKPLINKALFLIWTITLSDYEESFIEQFTPNLMLIEQAKELSANKSFLDSLSHGTSDKSVLLYLFQCAKELAQRVLNL